MAYRKKVKDGYILCIGIGQSGEEITESEYNEIMSVIQNRPEPEDGKGYRLKADLTWEEYEIVPIPEPEIEDPEEILDILMGVEE